MRGGAGSECAETLVPDPRTYSTHSTYSTQTQTVHTVPRPMHGESEKEEACFIFAFGQQLNDAAATEASA